MNVKTKRVLISLVLGVTLLIGLLLAMGATRSPEVALAQGSTARYVAMTGNDSGNDCTNSSTPCATIQHAVDVADAGEEIRVATGVYTDVTTRNSVTQVVYIDKSLTLRGGYTPTNWTVSDPETNHTILDAQRQGRGLYIVGEINVTIEGLQITGGYAKGGSGANVITATLTFSNNVIFKNETPTSTLAINTVGGGVAIHASPGATFTNNTIQDNHAKGTYGGGGGIAFIDSPDAFLINNIIKGNSQFTSLGGGIYLVRSPGATLISNTIISNTAIGWFGEKYPAHGGGLGCWLSDNLTLQDNVIRTNLAWQSGGGILLKVCNHSRLFANDMSENSACCGGGLNIENSQHVEITDNLFDNNSLPIFGGGASIIGSDAITLTNNRVVNHDLGTSEELDYGAGLYFDNDTNVLLTNNIIMHNGPAAFGGGVYLKNTNAKLVNNVIVDNQVRNSTNPDFNGSGSGLYTSGSSPRLLHNTLARNSGGDGSGIAVVLTSTVAMTNTILVSHTVGITVTAGNTATVNGVLWHGNGANTGGDGIFIVSNEYTDDPAFADDGYHLTANSAAIDKAVNTGVNDDIDGDSRPMGQGYDLGADELPISLIITKQAIPDPVQAGGRLTYTIRVTNTGHLTLTATITDILPAEVTPIGPLVWPPTNIAPGEVWTQPVVVTVKPDYSGVLTNVVQVTTAEGATGIYIATSEAQVPPASVTINGPITGTVNTPYTFTAIISPPTVTQPITYTWMPTPTSGQGTTVTYTWMTDSLKTITVSATNIGGTVTDTHTISITIVSSQEFLYLPIVLKEAS